MGADRDGSGPGSGSVVKARCGCCREVVHLVMTARSATLVEVIAGEPVPHQCDDRSVDRWLRIRRALLVGGRARLRARLRHAGR